MQSKNESSGFGGSFFIFRLPNRRLNIENRGGEILRLSSMRNSEADHKEAFDTVFGNLRVMILDSNLIKRKGKRFSVFKVMVETKTQKWTVYRRYRQFHQLYEEVKQLTQSLLSKKIHFFS